MEPPQTWAKMLEPPFNIRTVVKGDNPRPPPEFSFPSRGHRLLCRWIETTMKSALICQLLLAALAALASDTNLIAPGARLEKLAGDFVFTEGPAADGRGNIFFTDQPNDRILKWSIDDQLSIFLQPSGRANGLCFDAAGNLWICADAKNELWRLPPDGKPVVVLRDYEGKRFNGPNDLWISSNGDIYFTDPYYQRKYWDRGGKEMAECVYYLKRGAGPARRVIGDLQQPNGLIGTPDGRTLYVADIAAKTTYRYQIEASGDLSGKRLFCREGSDGMTLDDRGNVYLTGKGVMVYAPSGDKIKQIDVPEPWVGNVCFGGPDGRSLFITASKGLYRLRMAVRGVNSQ